MQKTASLTPVLYVIREKMLAILGSPGNRGYHIGLTLNTQLPIRTLIMEGAAYKLDMATVVSLIQGGGKLGPSDIYRLQGGVASLVPRSLPDAMVLE